MKLTLKNVGKFHEQCELEFNGITIVAGENGTGKSTVGKERRNVRMKIKRKLQNIRMYYQSYGFIGSLISWGLIRKINVVCPIIGCYKNCVKLYLKKYQKKMFVRKNSTDYDTLNSLVTEGQYKFLWESGKFHDIKHIIDAGANIGDFSVICSYYFPQAEIVAVEPEDGNYNILKKNIAINNEKHIRPLKKAVWNTEMLLKIRDVGNGEWGLVVEQGSEQDFDVEGISVDSIIKECGWSSVDVIKFDIEGSEMEVFSAENLKWLDKVKIVILEMHEFLKPGVTNLIYSEMEKRGFAHAVEGENTFFWKEDRM